MNVADLQQLRLALETSRKYFEARDQMNAEVHCAEIRWSPITVEMQNAHKLISRMHDRAKETIEMARKIT